MNPRPTTATVDGHASLETGVPPNKEGYISSHPPVPWYRKNKWRIAMLIGAIVVIGAVVGGAVGGTVGSKNRTTTTKPSGPVTLSLTSTSSSSVSTGGLGEATTANGVSVGSSQLPGQSTGSGGAVPTTRGEISLPTNSPVGNVNLEGTTDPGRGAAPIVVHG